MTPADFLAAIFNDVPPDERVCVTRPGPQSSWINYPATVKRLARIEAGAAPWYFCISTVAEPDDDGYLPRDRASCCYTYCIVLDDIGTKCEAPPVPPSWVLESSEGNYQWGYLIDPTGDVALVEGTQLALANAGWTDPGARGVYRVMRLPGSLHKTGFRARITEWHPARSWSLDGLLEAFSLEPAKVSVAASTSEPVAIGDVDDPLLDWLSANGHTTGVVGSKFVEVVCPWRDAHTSGGGVAGYTPVGYGGVFDGAFSCLHDHCSDKGKREFIEWAVSEGYKSPGTAFGASDASGSLPEDPPTGLDTVPASSAGSSLNAVDQLITLNMADLPDVQVDHRGNLKTAQLMTQDNVNYLLQALRLECRVNVMSGRREVGTMNSYAGMLHLFDYCQRLGMRDKQTLKDIIELRCDERPYHPFEEWLDGLPEWDGIDRVAQITTAVKTDETLWPIYFKRWLAQVLVGASNWRALEPVQLPYVLVLSGGQGIGKSTFFTRLVPGAFFLGDAELHLNSSQSKDHQLNALSRPVCELGELDSTFGQSYVGALKSFLSRTMDSLRAPYERTPVTRARSTVFCASVNPTEFLQDTTGNRRWWPVLVTKIDWKAVNGVELGQLWAQVKASGWGYELDAEEARRHVRAADGYTHRSYLRDVFDAYFDPLLDVDSVTWAELSLNEIAAKLKVEHEVRAPRYRAELVGLLQASFGDPKRHGRTRLKRYKVPVSGGERLG